MHIIRCPQELYSSFTQAFNSVWSSGISYKYVHWGFKSQVTKLQGYSKSETVSFHKDMQELSKTKQINKEGACFSRFVYGIMIISFDPTDNQQLMEDSLILLFDVTSDYTKYITKATNKQRPPHSLLLMRLYLFTYYCNFFMTLEK